MKSNDPFREVEQLLNRFWNGHARPRQRTPSASSPNWFNPTPRVALDVREQSDEFEVTADVPGFEKEDLSITIADDTLTIQANREDTADDEGEGRALRSERQGTIERKVSLPSPVKAEEGEATYSNGVLTIRVPKVGEDDGVVTVDIE